MSAGSAGAPGRLPCTGAILAGGAGRRMGGALKGLLAVDGARMVDRVAAALGTAADALVLVANDPTAAAWLPGVRVVPDLRPGVGALGGVHAALAHAAGPALVVAWDMPFVTAPLLAGLRALGEAHAADAVVPEGSVPGREEPLCAWYGPACLRAVERYIDAGGRRASGFLGEVRVRRVTRAELARFGDPDVLFANVNTREELAHASARAAGLA